MLRTFVLAAALATVSSARADAPIWPVAAFANPSGLDRVQLSPDGTRLAATLAHGERRALLTQKLDGSERQVAFVLDKPDVDLEFVRWIGNERLLMLLTNNNPGPIDGLVVPVTRLLSMKRDGSEKKVLSDRNNEVWINHAAREVPQACPGAPSVLVASLSRTPSDLAVNHFRFEAHPLGVREVVAPGLGERWWADARGRVRLLETRRDGSRRWMARALGEGDSLGRWTDLPVQPASMQWQVLGFDADPHHILLVASGETGRALQRLHLGDAAALPHTLATLPAHWQDRPTALLRNASSCAAVGVRQGNQLITWGDTLDALLGGIRKELPDSEVQLHQWQGAQYLVRIASVGNSPEWLLGDRNAGTLKSVAAPYPGLPVELGLNETRLPSGAQLLRSKTGTDKRPLVICLECALHERDNDSGFSPLAALLAHRGYAVFRPRPSSHREASFIDFTSRWAPELEQQLQELAEQEGLSADIDLGRIALVATANHGYPGLRWARDRRNPLRAIVSLGALTDLPAYRARSMHESITEGSSKSMQARIGGLKGEPLRAASIAQHAARLRAPTLVMQGDHDPMIGIEQAHALAKGLADAGLPHRLIRFERSGSQLLHPPYRLQAYEAIEAWLKEHL